VADLLGTDGVVAHTCSHRPPESKGFDTARFSNATLLVRKEKRMQSRGPNVNCSSQFS